MKNILLINLFILGWGVVIGQVPSRMNYQAIIRDNTNQLVASRTIRMRISMLNDSANAASVYTETHQATTSSQGNVSIEIGGGTVVSGKYTAIQWNKGKVFVKVETDVNGGNNYGLSQTVQMLSVPFSNYAGESESSRYLLDEYVSIWTNSAIVNLEVNKKYFINANNVTLVLPKYPENPVNFQKDNIEIYVMQHPDNPRTITLDYRNSLTVGVLDINNNFVGFGVNPPKILTGNFRTGVNKIINRGDYWMCAGFVVK